MIKTAIKAVDDTINNYREFHKYSIEFTMSDVEDAAIRLFYIYLYDKDSSSVHKMNTSEGAIYILDDNKDEEKYLQYIRKSIGTKLEGTNWMRIEIG